MRTWLLLPMIACLASVSSAQTPDPDYVLYPSSSGGTPGAVVTSTVLLDFPNGGLLNGASWGVCVSPGDDSLAVPLAQSIVPVGNLAAVNDGDGPAFFAPTVLSGGWTVGFVGFCEGDWILPIVGAELVSADYLLLGSPGDVVDLDLCETLGDPPVSITVVTCSSPGGVVPETSSGILEIFAFIRGDSDADGIFNGLADALHLLGYGFLAGDPPPCFEAADADGDGIVSPLVDAIRIVQHAFFGGPPLPPPYPDCGVDPDPGTTLGCEQYFGC